MQLVRAAEPRDAAAIAAIFNEGIEERTSTFETTLRERGEIEAWVAGERPVVIVADRDGAVIGWATLSRYSDRECYTGVGEASVYVASHARGAGVSSELATELASEAARRGYYKLIGKLFRDNEASARLVRRTGFREVGVHRRHGRLDGSWRDVVLVELLIGQAGEG